jgi:hypothetical protein
MPSAHFLKFALPCRNANFRKWAPVTRIWHSPATGRKLEREYQIHILKNLPKGDAK